MGAGSNWLNQYLPWMDRTAKQLACGNDALHDELLSYAAARADDVAATFSTTGGAQFSTHMYDGLVSYMHKWERDCKNKGLAIGGVLPQKLPQRDDILGRCDDEDSVQRGHGHTEIVIEDQEQTRFVDRITDSDQLEKILSQLPVEYRVSLVFRSYGGTLVQLSQALRCSLSSAKILYDKALMEAKRIAYGNGQAKTGESRLSNRTSATAVAVSNVDQSQGPTMH